MPVSWNKEYNPTQVVEKIENTRKVRDDGKVQFEGWGFKEFEALLYSMLNFSDDIPEIDARQIVSKAIFNCGGKGVITVQNLLAEISKLEQEYQVIPIKRYALASSISINQSLVLQKIKLENKVIIFEHSLLERFRRDTGEIVENAKQSLFASLPTDYLHVRVHVSAKSIHDAANQALEAVDFVRGVWNRAYNRQHFFRRSWGGKPKPVNRIILGPLHTLHKSDGRLAATNNWWFEPSYLGAIKPLEPKQDELEAIYKILSQTRKKLEKHKYPKIIQNAIIRYTRALDERDWTTAFLKLWSIVELLTDTIGANYDLTVKRTAYIYQDRDYHLQVLQHIRKYRNSSVHFDRENSEIEIYLYQIKHYVETLIGFHLNNKYGFESIQEAAAFLSLPYDDKALNSQIEKLQFAKKYRGYT